MPSTIIIYNYYEWKSEAKYPTRKCIDSGHFIRRGDSREHLLYYTRLVEEEFMHISTVLLSSVRLVAC